MTVDFQEVKMGTIQAVSPEGTDSFFDGMDGMICLEERCLPSAIIK